MSDIVPVPSDKITIVGSAVPAIDLEQMRSGVNQSQDWLDSRRKGIGSSDAPAILGLSPFKGPYAVWLSKVKGIDKPSGEAAEWGHRLEDPVAMKFRDLMNVDVLRPTHILQSPKHEFMLANLDRVVIDDEGATVPLEIKTTGSKWWQDDVPSTWFAQIQHQIAVTEVSHAWLAMLIGGQTFDYKRIERDDDFIDKMVEVEAEFWSLVESNTPPPLDGSKDTMDYLGSRTAVGSVELSYEAAQAVSDLKNLKKEMKYLFGRKSELEAKVKLELGEAAIGTHAGETVVTWGSHQKSSVSVKKVRELHPDILEDVEETRIERRFTIKG